MTTQMQLTYNDRSNEKSTLSIHFPQIVAGGTNFDAVISAMEAVEATIDAITLCDNAKQALYDIRSVGEDTPASPWAQRELGVRVFFVDDVNGEKGHFTIPGPDLASLDVQDSSDKLSLSGTLEAALVTALEANALSRDGNSITVQRMVIVGRRS